MTKIDNKNPHGPVVLFVPEAGIYPFVRGLSVLGDAIQKGGRKVLVTRDTGQMIRSPIMAMHQLPVNATKKDKSFIYKSAGNYLNKIKNTYGFSLLELSYLVDDKLFKEIDKLVEVPNKDLLQIKYRGFRVGEIAQYDFILETKFPFSSNLSKNHIDIYKAYIKNTALTTAIVEKICNEYKPSLFLTFNEYAQGQAVRYVAEKYHIKRRALTYPVHFNFDASRFSIWDTTCEYWLYRHCQNWQSYKDIPITKEDVISCWEDSVYRMYNTGSHVFSSRKFGDPGIVFDKLKLDPNKKTIVVYTSSQDERLSFEIGMKIWGEDNHVKDAFKNQIEWLLWLKKYVSKRDDIQIVVRIHPREGKRQRGYESKHLQLLKSKFSKTVNNFAIVWPDDPTSSYDLIELSDVCLVAWSLMGQEAARLGIPTLAYAGNMFYPDDDFIQVATSKNEYKKRLDLIISKQYSLKELTKAVRFYHWRNLIPAIRLSETVPMSYVDDTVWPVAPKSKIRVLNNILLGNEDLIKYNIKVWKKKLNIKSVDEEIKAMKYGIRYLVDKVFYPPNTPKQKSIFFLIVNRLWRELTGKNIIIKKPQGKFADYSLRYVVDKFKLDYYIKQSKTNKNLRFLMVEGMQTMLIHDGLVRRRTSPMIGRLAKLYL